MRAGNAGSTGPVIRCRHGRAARWRGSVKTECFVARQTTICSFSLVIRIARLPGNSSSSRGLDGLAKACGDVIRGLPACCGLSRGGNNNSGVCGSMLSVHPVLMASAAAGLPVEVLLHKDLANRACVPFVPFLLLGLQAAGQRGRRDQPGVQQRLPQMAGLADSRVRRRKQHPQGIGAWWLDALKHRGIGVFGVRHGRGSERELVFHSDGRVV